MSDDELKGMFAELREQGVGMRGELAQLREQVEINATETRGELIDLRSTATETRRELKELRQHVDSTSTATRNELKGLREHVDATAAETRRHVDTTAIETRRLFDVAMTGLKHDILLVVDGVVNLNEKVDRETADIRTEMRQGFGDTHALIRSSYGLLDRRVNALERRMPAKSKRR